MTKRYIVTHADGTEFPVFYDQTRGYVWFNLLTRKPVTYCIPDKALNAERLLRSFLDRTGHMGANMAAVQY